MISSTMRCIRVSFFYRNGLAVASFLANTVYRGRVLLGQHGRLSPAERDGRGNPVASGAVWQRGLRHFDVNVLHFSRAFALRLLSSAAF